MRQGMYIRNGDDTGGLTLAGFVAWLGAALSREFAYELLAAVTPAPEQVLHDALEQLVKAGLLQWMAVLFSFPSDPDPSPSEAPPGQLIPEESNGLRGVTR